MYIHITRVCYGFLGYWGIVGFGGFWVSKYEHYPRVVGVFNLINCFMSASNKLFAILKVN